MRPSLRDRDQDRLGFKFDCCARYQVFLCTTANVLASSTPTGVRNFDSQIQVETKILTFRPTFGLETYNETQARPSRPKPTQRPN